MANDTFDLDVSLVHARNCMNMIKKGAVTEAFESLGISLQDLELVTGPENWVPMERPRVTKVIDSLIHGTVDVMGLPRIRVPAEFRAACIATFVNPQNIFVACRWCESGPTVNDLADGGTMEPVTADQLIALCIKLFGEAQVARAEWEKTTKRAVRDVLKPVEPQKEMTV